MKTYKVIYTEHLVHAFYIDADSKDDAEDEFQRRMPAGKLDFSGGEVYDSNVERIEEVEGK